MASSRDKIIHTDKFAADKAAITEVLIEQKKSEQGETLSVLDALRRTRAARGGVGAPLKVPGHLRPGTEIIITDADTKLPESADELKTQMEGDD